jgi:hypothetical protein
MAKQPPAPPASPREWSAKDVAELRAVWAELRPESDDRETERRFFGKLLSPEESGDVFERWLMEAFRLSGATGEPAYQVPMIQSGNTREQIDGLIVDGGSGYLVEAKFWPGKVDFGPIALLHALIGFRPAGTMGLFFSPFGYTQPALESVSLLRPIRVLLFDRRDLLWALPPAGSSKVKATTFFRGRMLEMVRRKWLHAVRNAAFQEPAESPIDQFNPQES